MIISLCTDLAKLKENPNIKPVDGEAPLPASEIHNTGGTNIFYTDNTSVCGLTSLNGLDFLLELDYIVITSYEEIFGYYEQSSVTGERVLVPAIPAMTALYDQIYPRTPVSLPDGEVYTPPILMGVAAGYDTSNLDISER